MMISPEKAERLKSIFESSDRSYDAARTVSKELRAIMMGHNRTLIEGLYNYVTEGFRARDINVLERFGQKSSVFITDSVFYCISDEFKTHCHTEKAKRLDELRKDISRESDADYKEAYDLYLGADGSRESIKPVIKKLCAAIAKNPSAPYPRVLLAHVLSNEEKGLVTVKPVATWILNGIEVKGARTSRETRLAVMSFARSLPYRCYVIDEGIIDNARFAESGTPACRIDYMNEDITATKKHCLPTPSFLYHLAEDFARDKTRVSVRTLDACTLYDAAHYADPTLPVPADYTMARRSAYYATYRREFNEFLSDMDRTVKKLEEAEKAAKEFREREQQKRDEILRETIEIISEAKEKERAARIASEIELDLYDRGFFGHK